MYYTFFWIKEIKCKILEDARKNEIHHSIFSLGIRKLQLLTLTLEKMTTNIYNHAIMHN